MTEQQGQPQPPAPPAPPPRPKRHRWKLRIGLLLVAILLAAAGVTQYILSTDIPRRLALARLQKETGLRISADSLKTTWTGGTILENVTVALPLEAEPFASVPRVRLRHANLIAVVLDLPMRIRDIEIDQPRLNVMQDARGRWNVQEATELLNSRLAGKRTASEHLQLPRIRIHGAVVRIADNAGRKAAFEPVNVTGDPDGRLAWDLAIAVEPHLTVRGRLAPNQDWSHQLTFTGSGLDAALRPWLEDLPQPANFKGAWQGRFSGGTLSGRLDLEQANVADFRAVGAASITASADGARIAPHSLTIHSPQLPTSLRIHGGIIDLRPDRLEAQALRLALAGGSAQVGGRLDWSLATGSLSVAWTDLSLPDGIVHAGTLEGALDRTIGGGPRLRANLVSRGSVRDEKWEAELVLAGQGPGWQSIDLEGRIASLNWQGATPLTLQDILLHLRAEGPLLRLTSVKLGQTDRLQGSGGIHLDTMKWWVQASLKNQPLPHWPYPADVEFKASGTPRRLDLPSFDLRTGRLHATASGSFDQDRPVPVEARLAVQRIPFEVADPAARQLVAGGLRGDARLTGTIQPLNLRFDGNLTGQGVTLGKRSLGDVQFEVGGAIDGTAAKVRSSELQLLGGQWSFEGRYGFADRTARVHLEVADLPLKQLDGLVEPAPNIEGLFSAEVRGEWPLGGPAKPTVLGDWQVKDLSRGPVAVDLAAGSVSIDGDLLVLDDLVLRRGEGTGRGSIRFNLRDRNTVAAKLEMHKWPADFPAAQLAAEVSGKADVTVNIAKRSATGTASAEGAASYAGKPAGSFAVDSTIDGPRMSVGRLQAKALGGVIDGSASVSLDDWTNSAASLRLNGIRPAALAAWYPQAADIEGAWAGSIVAGPDTAKRPVEPMRVEVLLIPAEAHYGGLQFGQMTGTLAVGGQRIIISKSSLHLADGQMSLWGRLTRHDKEWFAIAQGDFERLNLAQLVRAAKPEADEMLGRLHGQLTFFGKPRKPRQLSGEFLLNISDSDLANSDVIGAMYQAMSVQSATKEPQGEGSARLRLQDGTLILSNATYRNRGVEVRASIAVQDLFLGADSPMAGYAVGTARPLSDLKLPLVRDLDDILSALQATATTMRVGGTVAEPRATPATLGDLSAEFKRAIVGDAKSQNEGK